MALVLQGCKRRGGCIHFLSKESVGNKIRFFFFFVKSNLRIEHGDRPQS